MTRHAKLLSVPFLALVLHYLAVTECTVINIKGLGSVRGTTTVLNGSTIDTFWGVPFAKPPVGNLRFAPPQMVEPWTGTKNGSKISCMQSELSGGKITGQEDCLYLNIFKRRSASSKNVMVFIHGGGYIIGQGYYYNGGVLAALHDVVVVTINYRLGILGFYSMPDTELTGNYGLQDQILALKWVKAHISDFGGDPSKVTIFGESAGAGSVSLLLLSPLAKGLFTRAIAQSGSALAYWAVYQKQNGTMALNFARGLGCSQSKMAACLRSKSGKEILLRQITLKSYSMVAPTVDGKLITGYPYLQSLANQLPILDVELMIGFNKDEGTMFTTPPLNSVAGFNVVVKEMLKWRYKEDTALVTEMASFEYRQFQKPLNQSIMLSYSEIIADYQFKEGVVKIAQSWAKAGKRVYLYDFTYLPEHPRTPAWGVAHAIELGFVFGGPLAMTSDWLVANYTKRDLDFSLRMMKMWTDFAKTGVPHSKWPVYGLADKSYLEINVNDTVRQDFSPKRMAFWHNTVPNVIALAKAQRKLPTSTPCTTQRTKSTASTNSAYTYGPIITTLFAFIICLNGK